MKKLVFALIAVLNFAWVVSCAHSKTVAKCERHKVETLKNFCLAERTGDISYCSNISDTLFNSTCRARVERREKICYEIKDMRQRQWCLTMLY